MSFLNSAESSSLFSGNSIASTLTKWFLTIEILGPEMQMGMKFQQDLRKGIRRKLFATVV